MGSVVLFRYSVVLCSRNTGVCVCVCVCVTCACCSADGNQMCPILGDGLHRQLVLTYWGLLHNSDCCQRRSLGALNDAADSAYRGEWLHLNCRRGGGGM